MGIALMLCLATAKTAYGKPLDAASGFIDVTASPYLANGNDTSDDTDEIQSAINALASLSPTGGGTLYFPKGVYRVGNPDSNPGSWTGFSLPAGITIIGTNSKYNGNCQIYLTDTGASNNKAIFKIEGNTGQIVIRDITLLGPQGGITTTQTGTVGIKATGTTGQSGWGFRFSDVTIMRFSTGISVEDVSGDPYRYQLDLAKLDHVQIWECNTGMYLNTTVTDWDITSSVFALYKNGVGIDIKRAGVISIRDSQGTGPANVSPGGTEAAETYVWVRGPHGNINLNNVQTEGIRNSLVIDYADYGYPITLVNNNLGDLILIRANCNFVSVGNFYRANTVRTVPPPGGTSPAYPGADHALLFSQGDYFAYKDNQNRTCPPTSGSGAECQRDFIINNAPVVSTDPPLHNALVMRAGETRVDVDRPARFKRPVGIGNVDAPENVDPDNNSSTDNSYTVLLNLATPNANDIQLRIGGSGVDSSGVEGCPSCYYEIRRAISGDYCNPSTDTNCTLGYLSFEGKQTSAYVGYRFNGPIVPFTDGGGTLGTSTRRWSKVWAINSVVGDAILSDKKTGQELYRIYEDETNIYFADIRTGKELMRLDKDGNLHVTGRVIEGAGQPLRKNVATGRSLRKNVAKRNSHSRRKRS